VWILLIKSEGAFEFEKSTLVSGISLPTDLKVTCKFLKKDEKVDTDINSDKKLNFIVLF
tara:strand:- start:349 stop:525 length:177 start_codon:yes stop_codon:yes gene_type:complete